MSASSATETGMCYYGNMPIRIVEELDENIGLAEYPSHPGELVKVYLPDNQLGRKPLATAEAPPWLKKAAAKTKLTSRRSAELLKVRRGNAARRREEAEAAVRDGMVRGVEGLHPGSVKGSTEAWGVLAERRTELAYAVDAQGSNKAHEMLGKLSGLTSESRGTVNVGQIVQLVVGGEAAEDMADYLDVVDGEWKDG